MGVIQLRSWGAHELVAAGAGSHPLGLGLAAIRAGNFAITCMVPRPSKTKVSNAIKSRLSNFVNAIKSRRSNFGIAQPLSPRDADPSLTNVRRSGDRVKSARSAFRNNR